MMRSLYSAVSGLKTHQTRMDVIGNNIANVNTEAFKASSVRFSEIMYQTTSGASAGNGAAGTGGKNAKQIGLGVKSGATAVNITGAGSAETTGNPFDLRLNDKNATNFFVVSDGTNRLFTRAGDFYVDGNGYLCMSSTGYTLQGWQVDAKGNVIKDTVSSLQVMSSATKTSAPEATTKAYVSGVLDKNDAQAADTGRIITIGFFDDLGYNYTAKFGIKKTVSFSNWDKIVDEYEKPCVFIKIGYTQGLNGSNILVLKEKDVKIITDLMMGGDGTNINGEIGELHLSAISEAMNQMMGSSATSLSSMLNRTIDISPPIAEVVDLKNTLNEGEIDSFLSEEFVKISFHMEIGDLVDSEIMQLYPPAFVKEMCKGVSQNMELDTQSVTEDVPQSSNTATQAAPIQQPQDSGSMNNASANSQGMINENMMNSNMNSQNMMNQGMMNQNMGAQNMIGNQVNVQNAQFTPFGAMPNQVYQPENIDLIMDVPLEVTVELGRTKKSISEILDFGPGKIIELNKLAGEPIDILVNGKYVAKGEVVVIEESFGVRITEIVNSKINTGKTK